MLELINIEEKNWVLMVLGRGPISKKTGKYRGRIWKKILSRKEDLNIPPFEEEEGRRIVRYYNIPLPVRLVIGLGGRGRGIQPYWTIYN